MRKLIIEEMSLVAGGRRDGGGSHGGYGHVGHSGRGHHTHHSHHRRGYRMAGDVIHAGAPIGRGVEVSVESFPTTSCTYEDAAGTVLAAAPAPTRSNSDANAPTHNSVTIGVSGTTDNKGNLSVTGSVSYTHTW